MGGLFGKTTYINHDRIGSFSINNSTYGLTVPVVCGTNRISGNIIDYYDFTAIAHKTSQRTGKGGGSKTVTTDYTYKVTTCMGLCEGPIQGIGRVWADSKQSSLAKLSLTLMTGSFGQSPWGYTSGVAASRPDMADHALPYSGLAYVAGVVDLGSSSSLPTLGFEVQGMLLGTGDGTDANPADVVKLILTNPVNGIGLDASHIDEASLAQYRQYCAAADLLISPAWSDSKKAVDVLKDILTATDVIYFWSQDKLKFVPRCDVAIAGSRASYTPDLTPVYDLTDADFIDDDDGALVTFERANRSDTYNHQEIKFSNRANEYNEELGEFKVQTDINRRGVKTASQKDYPFICTKARAEYVAQLLVQESLLGRTTYKFTTDWSYCLLEPGDIVTITDDLLGLDKLLVRIENVEEQDDRTLKFEAKLVSGAASAAKYARTEYDRPKIDYGIDPGNIADPVLFAGPPELTKNGYEVWAAVTGKNTDAWGGCNIWASYDGLNYQYIGQITAPARMGTVTADTGSVLSVLLDNGTLLSGTQDDMNRMDTLCYVDGELLAYQNATLTAALAYDLKPLKRGGYNTTNTQHAAGSSFVRADTALFKYPFDQADLGKKIYLKFTSYNVYNTAEQSLADVKAYTYTLASIDMPAVTSVEMDEDTYILRDGTVLSDILVSYPAAASAIVDHYNIWYDLNDSGQWQYSGISQSTTYRIKALPQARSIRVKVAVVSKYGMESAGTISSTYMITGKSALPPNVTGFAWSQNKYNREQIVLVWDDISQTAVPDLKGYEVRLGNTSWAESRKLNGDAIAGNTFTYTALESGTYTCRIKSIDNSGNYADMEAVVTATVDVVPSAVTGLTTVQSSKDHSKAVISFTASPGEDILYYAVRYGSTWGSGTRIIETKETVLEWAVPKSGTYNIMVQAVTIAGHESAVTNASITIGVEPLDVTGFTATQSTTDRTRITLAWNAPDEVDVAYYVIKEGASWATAAVVSPRLSGTLYDVIVTDELQHTWLIKAVTIAGNESQYASSVSGVYSLRPSTISNLQVQQNASDRSILNIQWAGVTDGDLTGYQVKLGDNWESAEALPFTRELYATYPLTQSGTFKVMIKTVNAAGYYSDEVSLACTVQVEPNDVTGLVAYQNGDSIELYWDRSEDADVVGYEVREGYSFDQGTLIATGVTNTDYTVSIDTMRAYRYFVKAINRAGYYSRNAAGVSLTADNLAPRNIIQTVDAIVLANGTHVNTEFGQSLINFQTIGGRWSDYPTTKFSEVGGSSVLKLLKAGDGTYPANGSYTTAIIDIGSIITGNVTALFTSTAMLKGGSVVLQVRLSQDGTAWLDWETFKPIQRTFRYLQFKVLLATNDTAKTPEVNQFAVSIDVPDTDIAMTAAISAGGTTVQYGHTYYTVPVVVPAAVGSGLHAELISKTTSNCVIRIRDAANADASGTADIRIKGY